MQRSVSFNRCTRVRARTRSITIGADSHFTPNRINYGFTGIDFLSCQIYGMESVRDPLKWWNVSLVLLVVLMSFAGSARILFWLDVESVDSSSV